MEWCHEKKQKKKIDPNNSKCVGILHAQFTIDKEVYIIALSGTGYKLDIEPSSGVNIPAPYNTVWENLSNYLKEIPGIPEYCVAKFDAVHKACLATYRGVNNDPEFLEKWRDKLKNWVGQWHKHFEKMKKKNVKFTINCKSLVKQGMKNTYLEQMKVEAPSEKEAEERFKDIVDFLTVCIPEYQPNSNKLPLRMKIIEILHTKNIDEIKDWFKKELETNNYKTDFEGLCRKFLSKYYAVLICWHISCFKDSIPFRGVAIPVTHIAGFRDYIHYWQKIGELISDEYIKEYNKTNRLPKGYAEISMIWGGIWGARGGILPPDEIKDCFMEELETTLNQYKTDFERLRRKFLSKYHAVLTCRDISYSGVDARGVAIPVTHIAGFRDYLHYWQKIGELIINEYIKEYDETNRSPKGYAVVSMIWEGILQGGFKYGTGIADLFIQCAEDNALCTLESYVEERQLHCKKISWSAFKYHNFEHKPLCAICKHTFKARVAQALSIEEELIDIEGESVSSDTNEDKDEEYSYGILSYNDQS